MKIILAGPPHSGKSCLRDGLRKAVMRLRGDHYLYVITAAPDGEGSWFQETYSRDPEYAISQKQNLRIPYSDQHLSRIEESIRNCKLPLTCVDVGGLTTPENERICRVATHAILIAGDEGDTGYGERLEPWREFCERCQLEILAEIYSDYLGENDRYDGVVDGIFRGAVHYLERGEPVENRLLVLELAKFLVDRIES